MSHNLAPDLGVFVVAFLVLDVLGAIALVGAVAMGATSFLGRHRRVRTARHERVLPYYGHLVAGH